MPPPPIVVHPASLGRSPAAADIDNPFSPPRQITGAIPIPGLSSPAMSDTSSSSLFSATLRPTPPPLTTARTPSTNFTLVTPVGTTDGDVETSGSGDRSPLRPKSFPHTADLLGHSLAAAQDRSPTPTPVASSSSSRAVPSRTHSDDVPSMASSSAGPLRVNPTSRILSGPAVLHSSPPRARRRPQSIARRSEPDPPHLAEFEREVSSASVYNELGVDRCSRHAPNARYPRQDFLTDGQPIASTSASSSTATAVPTDSPGEARSEVGPIRRRFDPLVRRNPQSPTSSSDRIRSRVQDLDVSRLLPEPRRLSPPPPPSSSSAAFRHGPLLPRLTQPRRFFEPSEFADANGRTPSENNPNTPPQLFSELSWHLQNNPHAGNSSYPQPGADAATSSATASTVPPPRDYSPWPNVWNHNALGTGIAYRVEPAPIPPMTLRPEPLSSQPLRRSTSVGTAWREHHRERLSELDALRTQGEAYRATRAGAAVDAPPQNAWSNQSVYERDDFPRLNRVWEAPPAVSNHATTSTTRSFSMDVDSMSSTGSSNEDEPMFSYIQEPDDRFIGGPREDIGSWNRSVNEAIGRRIQPDAPVALPPWGRDLEPPSHPGRIAAEANRSISPRPPRADSPTVRWGEVPITGGPRRRENDLASVDRAFGVLERLARERTDSPEAAYPGYVLGAGAPWLDGHIPTVESAMADQVDLGVDLQQVRRAAYLRRLMDDVDQLGPLVPQELDDEQRFPEILNAVRERRLQASGHQLPPSSTVFNGLGHHQYPFQAHSGRSAGQMMQIKEDMKAEEKQEVYNIIKKQCGRLSVPTRKALAAKVIQTTLWGKMDEDKSGMVRDVCCAVCHDEVSLVTASCPKLTWAVRRSYPRGTHAMQAHVSPRVSGCE